MRLRERPIFLYHQIGDYPPERMEYGVTLPSFRAHLEFIANAGYEVIGLERMLRLMKGEIPFSPKAVSLTFDGGFLDAYTTVLPLLLERGWKAAFFIPTEFVGKEHGLFKGTFPCMDWEQIRELVRAGMTVGSYGRRGILLKNLSESERREDARIARETLEDKVGVAVKYHGYRERCPDEALRAWFIEQGFEAVLTQAPTYSGTDPYRIGRVQIDDEDANIFKTKASLVYLFFKDTRTWWFIRKLRIAKFIHLFYALFEKKH